MTQAEQRSAEWFEARKGRVTASMVGAILGHSPHMTRKDAMRSMVRSALGVESEFQGNIATQHGNYHEEGAIFDYTLETKIEVQKSGFIPHEDWAGCSPDGLIGFSGVEGGLEVKCHSGSVPLSRLMSSRHLRSNRTITIRCSFRYG